MQFIDWLALQEDPRIMKEKVQYLLACFRHHVPQLMPGTWVHVTLDGGKSLITRCRREPRQLGGAMVIDLEGVSGGYLATRCRPLDEQEIIEQVLQEVHKHFHRQAVGRFYCSSEPEVTVENRKVWVQGSLESWTIKVKTQSDCHRGQGVSAWDALMNLLHLQ